MSNKKTQSNRRKYEKENNENISSYGEIRETSETSDPWSCNGSLELLHESTSGSIWQYLAEFWHYLEQYLEEYL